MKLTESENISFLILFAIAFAGGCFVFYIGAREQAEYVRTGIVYNDSTSFEVVNNSANVEDFSVLPPSEEDVKLKPL